MRRGARGESVRDLQQRLGVLGFAHDPDPPGDFGGGTEAAVRGFQAQRGLQVDGRVGHHTWSSLVEGGFTLGDRLIYVRRPNLRGDDVADLQRRLDALGFDVGRLDGIFGPDSDRALRGFQRSAGLIGDGICGPSTVAALDRVGGFAAGAVAAAREREALRHGPQQLDGRRFFVTAAPGLEVLGEAVVRRLTLARTSAMLDASGDDEANLARVANATGADVVLDLRFGPEPGVRVAYFETTGFRSEMGRLVAQLLGRQLAGVLGEEVEVVGRAYPSLRETRATAVVTELGARGDPVALARTIRLAGDLARAYVRAARLAYETPGDPFADGDPAE